MARRGSNEHYLGARGRRCVAHYDLLDWRPVFDDHRFIRRRRCLDYNRGRRRRSLDHNRGRWRRGLFDDDLTTPGVLLLYDTA
jgi:hypothetical protein